MTKRVLHSLWALVFAGLGALLAIVPAHAATNFEVIEQNGVVTHQFLDGVTQNVDTIADLRTVSVPSDYSGPIITVLVQGNATAGDGGGGRFQWSAMASCGDDNGSCIEPTGWSGDGRWLRASCDTAGPSWSPVCYGADPTGTDSSVAAFQAAVNAVANGTSGNNTAAIVTVPAGTYAGALSGLTLGYRTITWQITGAVSFPSSAPPGNLVTGATPTLIPSVLGTGIGGIEASLFFYVDPPLGSAGDTNTLRIDRSPSAGTGGTADNVLSALEANATVPSGDKEDEWVGSLRGFFSADTNSQNVVLAASAFRSAGDGLNEALYGQTNDTSGTNNPTYATVTIEGDCGLQGDTEPTTDTGANRGCQELVANGISGDHVGFLLALGINDDGVIVDDAFKFGAGSYGTLIDTSAATVADYQWNGVGFTIDGAGNFTLTSTGSYALGVAGTTTTSALVVSNAATFDGQITGTLPGPAWTSPNFGTYDAMRMSVGSFNQDNEGSGGASSVAQNVVGTLLVPGTAAAGDLASAASGWAATSTANVNAVGLVGFGGIQYDGTHSVVGAGAEGLNAVVENCGGSTDCPTNGGYQGVNLYGVEIDAGLFETSGSAAPESNLRGLWIVGSGTATQTQINSDYNSGNGKTIDAIDIGPLGISQSPVVSWPIGLAFEPGATQTAINIGAASASGSSASQKLVFNGNNGSADTGTINVDASGNLALASSAGTLTINGDAFTLSGALTFANLTGTDDLLYVTSSGNVGQLATANSSILSTSSSGVPSLATALPNGITATTQTGTDNTTKVATDAFVHGNFCILTGCTVTGTLELTENNSSVNATEFVDTNTSGRTWYMGPEAGDGVVGHFNIYDGTGTDVVASFVAGTGIQTPGLIATAAASNPGSGKIMYGATTEAAGSGTCPSGTIGGQTVQGCDIVYVGTRQSFIPYF